VKVRVPFTGQATIKESARLHCPVCSAEVHYILAQLNGPGMYQPCGHFVKVVKRYQGGEV
jgi:hypothetical protein